MIKFLKRRGVLVFIGLVLLSAFIWYAGPYFAFATFQPLASEPARLIGIGILFLWWLLALLLKLWKSQRASSKLAQAVVAQESPRGATREAAQLRERFEEAMSTLKTQGGGKNLYELPWYVIIGPPGSGKTTALVNSGLKFPLEQRFGREALRGVGGTRNCDWWFTDEAVLLDTAGRYTTQDSDESADSAGWSEFLKLLTQHRKRRPLNGVMVALSASDLMTQTPAEREANIAAVRRRLDELNRYLKVRLPVYLLVTKCDLISGFTEYFDDLDAPGRAQVWGVTFSADHSQTGKAGEGFPAEFDALVERLNRRLFARMHEERDSRRRTAVYAFPQQLAGLRGFIAGFIQEVFAATRFDGRLLLRGVYFTSGTQEGTPIDRMMAAIGRGFSLSADAYSSGVAGRGKAYFIENLLREVIFAEAGIAGVNRVRELRLAAAQLATYAAMLLIALVGVIALSVSFNRNKNYLAEIDASLDALRGLSPPTPRQQIGEIVPWLDAVRSIDESANRFRRHLTGSMSMRFGLFQGGAVGDNAHGAYMRELNGALLPRLGEEFKARLESAAAESDKLYQYLKAYLMLGEPKHLDKPQLSFLASIDWQEMYANQPDVLQSLGLHLQSLTNDQDAFRPLPLDDTLVQQTRNTVRQASLPRLMYDQLKLSKMDDKSHDVHLDIDSGIGAERVFTFKSGRKLSDPIPGLYTRAVFDQVSLGGTAGLVKQFSQDSWVMGDSAFDPQSAARMTSQVMDLYADEYIKVWDGVLHDIQMVPLKTLAQTADVLAQIGDKSSPLKGLLITVDANTNLTKPLEGVAKPGVVASAEGAVSGSLSKIFHTATSSSGPTPAEKITAHFAAVNQLVAGPPGAAPIDAVMGNVAQIHQKLARVGTAVGDTSPTVAMATGDAAVAVRALQVQAATLPAPVNVLVAAIGGRSESLAIDQARGELDQRYREQVVQACQQIIANRYPFSVGSATDVPVADFARLFGNGGIYDAFFKENLAPLVDASHSPWVWRPGGSGPAGSSSAMLRQFELAQQIRENYFSSGAPTPDQQFTLTPGELDVNTARFTLEVDGQALDYRHGPVRSMAAKWPGPSPGMANVAFEDAGGVRPNLNFVGPWAWFRLLDAAIIKPDSDVRFVATFQISGHSGAVIVEAPSIRNPYQKAALRQFRCAV